MKKQSWRRIGALLLSLVMAVGLAVPSFATSTANTAPTITAAGPQNVVVAENTLPTDVDPFKSEGTIEAEIDRDYAQEVKVALNGLGMDMPFYMTVENPNPDLSMNFVNVGTTPGEPSILPADGETEVVLAIFAQEAERELYENIKLVFHISGAGRTERSLKLTVKGPGMDITHTEIEDPTTRDISVTLANNGAAVNSLKVEADSALAPYAFFPEPITNYELAENGNVTFKVSPVNMTGTFVSGNLLVKGNGQTVSIPVTLNNPSYQEVTGSELALQNNKLKDAEEPKVESLELKEPADGSGDPLALTFEIGKGEGADPMEVSVGISMEINPTENRTEGADVDSAWENDVKVVATRDTSSNKYTFTISHYLTAAEFKKLAGTQQAQLEELDEEMADLLEGERTTINDVLMKYSIEVDFGDADISDFTQRFNDMEGESSRLAELDNMPNVPDSIKERYAAAIQLQMLLNLLNELAEKEPDKYGPIKQKIADEVNKQYNPPVEDPLKVLEESLKKLIESTEKKIVKKYPEFKDDIAKDAYKPSDTKKPIDDVVPDEPSNSSDKNSTVVINEKGHQCTNRGEITSQWYVQDTYEAGSRAASRAARTAADIGARVFYTGRIVSEDKYVNFEPIKYDLRLNGQSFGTSENSGLSELNIIELDASKVLVGQTNTFTRDYDVDPGTHFINTDNRFIVVYPKDAVLQTTDSNSITTPTPDFDVYRKNIFVTDSLGNYVDNPIAGQNNLHVSISNRGAHSGFFKLSVTDGADNQLLQSGEDTKLRYMSAFDSQTLKLPVTLTDGTNNITVIITDAGTTIRDQDSSNNTATMTLTARARQTPTIKSVAPVGSVTVQGSTLNLSAVLENYADVNYVTFTVDSLDSQQVYANARTNGNFTTTMFIGADGLATGNHTVSVTATYYSGGPNDTTTTTTAATTGTFTLAEAVEPSLISWGAITLPVGTTIDNYQLLTYNEASKSYGSEYCTVRDAAGGGKELAVWAGDVESDSPKGKILMAYDSTAKKLYAGTVGDQGTAIDLTVQRKVTLTGGTLSTSTYYNSSVYISGISSYNIARTAGGTEIELPPLVFSSLSDYFVIDGHTASARFSDLDLSTGDKAIDLSGQFTTCSFTVPVTSLNAYFLYKYQNGASSTRTGWQSLSGSVNTGKWTGVLSKSSVPSNPLASAFCIRYTSAGNETVHFINSDAYTADMSLAGLTTHKLSFTADDPSKLTSVTVSQLMREDGLYLPSSINEKEFLCTPGQYTASIGFTYDGVQYSIPNQKVDLTAGDQTINLTTTALNAKLKFTWPDSLGTTATVTLITGSGSVTHNSVAKDAEINVAPNTYRSIRVSFSNPSSSATTFVTGETAAENGKTKEVKIGTQFTGTLEFTRSSGANTTYDPGENVSMRLRNVQDEYGNTVSNCSLVNTGYVIFQPETGKAVRQEVSIGSIYDGSSSFRVYMPDLGGKYALAFSTDPNQKLLTHTIQASATDGGTISPSGSVGVMDGLSMTFTIQASSGYQLSDVKVDGTSVGAVSSYTFQNVTGNHTIEAIFTSTGGSGSGGGSSSRPTENKPDKPDEPDTPETKLPFSDIPEGSWYYDDVKAVYENKLFSGVSEDKFAPDLETNRAMFVTVLSRLENLINGTEIKGSADFSDVASGQWYSEAIGWATEEGIAKGYGNGKFGVSENVTRQECCAFFIRYLESINFDLSGYRQQPTFVDHDKISSWAEDAVGTMEALGLINGRGNGQFDPQAFITRAECAAIYNRLLQLLTSE